MSNLLVIYFRGDDWYLATGADGTRWLKLALDNGSQLVLPIPEELALKISEKFIQLEENRHQAELRRLQGRE